jgi:hypothetical protein
MKKLLLVCALFAAGCSGVKNTGTSGGTGSTTQNATISGPYNAVATSSKGNGTTNIYANLSMQSTTSFSASPSTLVCPANVPQNCIGDSSSSTVTLTGTVNGNNVQMTIQFTNQNGSDTVTLSGATNGTSLSGTYTDSQGDAGSWTATPSSSSVSGTYNGTVNSTPNPSQTAPTLSALLTEGQSFNLTGSASVSNSLCFTSLDFSQGAVIGGAFTVTDTTKDVSIGAVPTGSKTYSVFYQIGSSAAACSGDYGTGTFTLQ